MTNYSKLAVAALFLSLAMADRSHAGLVTAEEGLRQTQVFEQLKIKLGAETTDAGKFLHIARVMKSERDANFRRRILETATQLPGPALESFLTAFLANDDDAGLRGTAATALGKIGSEKCLPTLAEIAKNDRTSDMQIGCIVGRSSARRAATFAIAEFVGRFPKLADDATGRSGEWRYLWYAERVSGHTASRSASPSMPSITSGR